MARVLDVETITEPFDLQTALEYLWTKTADFIRFKTM